MVWHNPPERKQAKVYVRKAVDVENRPECPSYFAWLRNHLERMHKVFSPRVKSIAASEGVAAGLQ